MQRFVLPLLSSLLITLDVMMLHVLVLWRQILTSVKQTRLLRSPDASPHELMITMNYKCRVHMCTRSHVCMQHDGWILFFHYSSIMKPQTGIFICIEKKNHPICYCLLCHANCLLWSLEKDLFFFQPLKIRYLLQAAFLLNFFKLLIVMKRRFHHLNELMGQGKSVSILALC